MHNLRFLFIKSCLTFMEQTLSGFAIKVDEKALNALKEIDVLPLTYQTKFCHFIWWCKVKHASGD